VGAGPEQELGGGLQHQLAAAHINSLGVHALQNTTTAAQRKKAAQGGCRFTHSWGRIHMP
jgi:hypothetical protein